MKRVLGMLLLAFCVSAQASVDYYEGNGVFFPDEVSPHGLPEAIPCVSKKAYTGQTMLVCTWLANARYVGIYDPKRQMDVRYNNQVGGMCTRGICRVQNAKVGHWKEDVPFLMSIWYTLGTSTDGKPVAYRTDATRPVSYAEAGTLLWQFYEDAGIPTKELVSTFDKRYDGGWAAWNQQRGTTKVAQVMTADLTVSPVQSAWCNPQQDDDCYVNEKKVPQAQLGKYLPALSRDQVQASGGYCEPILCFNESDEPIGYLK